jgi:hypothetical protein
MSHNLDITKWPDTKFAKWAELVNQMPALNWNHKDVDSSQMTTHIAKLALSSLPRATPLRTTKTLE